MFICCVCSHHDATVFSTAKQRPQISLMCKTYIQIIVLLFIIVVITIPRVKSSKKLKSKAVVAMHLNRPDGTPEQQQSHKIAQS